MQPTEWEKILANHISNKGLIFKICKKLTQLNNNKNPIKKWAESLKRHFPKTTYIWPVSLMKRYPESLTFRGMQIKTTVGNDLASVRMAVIKKNTCWWQCGEKERELCLHCWWECELVQPPCNSMQVPQNTNSRTTTWPSNFTSGYLSEEMKH